MNLFLAACRMARPLQLGISYSGEPETLRRSLRQPFVVVGSNPGADLPLVDRQVSDRHAYLQMLGGRVFCVDLGSRTGIQWGQESGRGGWVHPRQSIRLGGTSLCFFESGQEQTEAARAPENPLVVPAQEGDSLPEVILELKNGPAAQKPWRMNRQLALVGRAPECKVHIVGARVSRFHASLVRTPQGVWAVDLLAKDGIYVNDRRVRWARLDEGDELRVGNFAIRLRYGTPPLSSPDEVAPTAAKQRAAYPRGPGDFGHLQVTPARLESPTALPAAPLQEPLLGNPAATASLLVPLAEQFAAMQQRMFAQFQQGMVMMFQMFHATQEEQLGQIREELDRLHDITRELTALQTEMVRQNLESPVPVPEGPSPPAGRPGQPASGANGNGGIPASPSFQPPEAFPAGPQGLDPPSPSVSPQAAGDQPQDVHAWLTQRIAGLERERQGRWQKILDFLRGK
jgi:pSer/pThr/pTyr-binding forkhead associated (FHA) protein